MMNTNGLGKSLFLLRSLFLLTGLIVLQPACTDSSDSGTADTATSTNKTAQPAKPAPTSSRPPAPPTAGRAAPVDSAGQNFTYSTEGELNIVGTEYNYSILLPTDFLFDFDKHTIRPEASTLLQKLKKHFATHRTDQVHVIGHTDSKGPEHHNNTLSQLRAGAVQRWLKANTGVFAMALGMGEREPLAPNENPDGTDNPKNRQLNRRVTIAVVVYPDVKKMIDKAKAQSRGEQ